MANSGTGVAFLQAAATVRSVLRRRFSPGQTSRTLTVPVLGDLLLEGDDVFAVTLSAATGEEIVDGTGAGTINDDEVPCVVGLGVPSLAISEATGVATIPVARTEAAIRTKRRNTTALVLHFAAAINAGRARTLGAYRLALAGKDKTFGTRDDKAIRIKSAVNNAAAGTVTLTPARPFAKTLSPRLTVLGTGPLSLVDLLGRPIDVDRDGIASGDAVLAIRRV